MTYLNSVKAGIGERGSVVADIAGVVCIWFHLSL